MRIQILDPAAQPDFLDLPWDSPLESWHSARVVDIAMGSHRHVVRFVDYDGTLYAVKELPDRLAEREFRILRQLGALHVPAVTPVGCVVGRSDACGGEGALVTRHLTFSLSLRMLMEDGRMPHLHERMLDAMVGLLVRCHVSGLFWGDCSLANTLFRRDAGALSAYVVDVETAEVHATLSAGQRRQDLHIARENLLGGLLDLEASGVQLMEGADPVEIAEAVEGRYDRLWAEVTQEESFQPSDKHRIVERIRRINDLGFDVEEVELVRTADGERVVLTPRVVELGYHGPHLQELTGVRAQENQARRLLNEIAYFRSGLEGEAGRAVPETVAAARWLDTAFEPTVAMVPAELRGKLEPAELYHQIIDHRWFLSENRGSDVGIDEAARSYIDSVLRHAPDEKRVIEAG
jgi:Domain of unknown function (DUF4032)/Lipopolysaccharide kinase (Kdo/WaaP) family